MDSRISVGGIDVSGCDYVFNTDYEFGTHIQCIEPGNKSRCRDNQNCLYKRYQRLVAQYNQVVEQNKSLQINCFKRHNIAQNAISKLQNEKSRLERTLDDTLIALRDYLQVIDKTHTIYQKISAIRENSTLIEDDGTRPRIFY